MYKLLVSNVFCLYEFGEKQSKYVILVNAQENHEGVMETK